MMSRRFTKKDNFDCLARARNAGRQGVSQANRKNNVPTGRTRRITRGVTFLLRTCDSITLRSLVSAAVLNGARRSCLGESGQKVEAASAWLIFRAFPPDDSVSCG